MHETPQTLLWISGATKGIGLGLARNAPYPGARIINLSRRPHPDYESISLDLADPATWDRARESFRRELAGFAGRAVFIHNAFYSEAVGLVGRVESAQYEKSVLANVAAPLVMAEAFISACPPNIEAGLVIMSSGSAVTPLEGLATYCAAKIAIEHWVEVVQRERESRGGQGPWVVAVRPGGVDTAPARAAAALSPENLSARGDNDASLRSASGHRHRRPPDLERPAARADDGGHRLRGRAGRSRRPLRRPRALHRRTGMAVRPGLASQARRNV